MEAVTSTQAAHLTQKVWPPVTYSSKALVRGEETGGGQKGKTSKRQKTC